MTQVIMTQIAEGCIKANRTTSTRYEIYYIRNKKLLGEAILLEYGEWVFVLTESVDGGWTSYVLRDISRVLTILNTAEGLQGETE